MSPRYEDSSATDNQRKIADAVLKNTRDKDGYLLGSQGHKTSHPDPAADRRSGEDNK